MKTQLIFCTTVFCLLVAASLQAAPITVPTDLSVGDKYRLAFVTSTTRDATSISIADYNAFVFTAANLSPELAALGTTWTAIGSTATVDARDNTGTNPSSTGFPIYRLDDTRIANNNADLWDGDIQVPIRFLESGSVTPSNRVWTGTESSGVGQSNRELGHANPVVAYGDPLESASGWILLGGLLETDVRRLYGMSGVLTVVPELAGDLNEDGFVDAADAGTMFSNWGPTTLGYYDGNLNGDAFIDAADAGIMFANWTGDVGPVGATIPEPSSLLLVSLAGLFFCTRRQ